MTRRGVSRGVTLVEMLAVTAIVGILAMTGLGLVTSLVHAADSDGLTASEADRRLMILRRVRAEASRSRLATVENGRLALWSQPPENAPPGWSSLGTHWCVRGGVLDTAAVSSQECDASAIRVRTQRHGSVVELDLADYGRVVVLVGGGPP